MKKQMGLALAAAVVALVLSAPVEAGHPVIVNPATPVVTYAGPPIVTYYVEPASGYYSYYVPAVPVGYYAPPAVVSYYPAQVVYPARVSRGLFGKMVVKTPHYTFKY